MTKRDLFCAVKAIESTDFARTETILEDWTEEFLTFCTLVTDGRVRDEDLFSFLDRGSGSNDADITMERVLSARNTVVIEDGGSEEETSSSFPLSLFRFVTLMECEAENPRCFCKRENTTKMRREANVPIEAADGFETIDIKIGLSRSLLYVERSLSELVERRGDVRKMIGTSVKGVDQRC